MTLIVLQRKTLESKKMFNLCFSLLHDLSFAYIGKKDEELVWLENPSGDFKSGTWATHVLTHGPGVYFRFTQMNTTEGMKNCIFTAQFFTKSLSVYWTTQSGGLFSDASQVYVNLCA